jgi:hypothetical protein
MEASDEAIWNTLISGAFGSMRRAIAKFLETRRLCFREFTFPLNPYDMLIFFP